MPQATTSRIELQLVVDGECTRTVVGTFRYEAADPFAVRLRMVDGAEVVEWTFARDLLAHGLDRPAGLGDVQIHPCTAPDGSAALRIELSSSAGYAVLQMSAGEPTRFLDASYSSVPLGMETDHLDVDAAVAALLTGC